MLALSKISGIKKKAPQSANSSEANTKFAVGALRVIRFYHSRQIKIVNFPNLITRSQLTVPEPKTVTPVGVFRRKDFPHLPMPLQVREYLSMRTMLSLCGHKVGRGWFPDSLSRAIKSTGQVNTGGRVEPQADSILMGAYRKGNYCL